MTDLPPPPPPKGAIPPQAALPPRSPRIWPWIVGIVGVVVLIAIAIGAQWTSNQEPGTSDLGTEGSSSVVADDVAGNGYFDIFMVVRDAPLHEPFTVEAIDRTRFDFADGWDFGDRVAYACTWAEFYQGQDEKFEIAYHLVGDYPDFAQINDKYGAEIEGGDAGLQPICLQDSGVTNRRTSASTAVRAISPTGRISSSTRAAVRLPGSTMTRTPVVICTGSPETNPARRGCGGTRTGRPTRTNTGTVCATADRWSPLPSSRLRFGVPTQTSVIAP